MMGACFAAYVGVRLGGPGPLALAVTLIAGVVGGAIWAGIAGVLRYWRNVPEVLTTLLLTAVAANLMGYGLRQRWLLLAPAAGRANRNQVSEPLPADARIPRLTMFGNEFPISVLAGARAGAGAGGRSSVGRSSASACACSAATRARRAGPASSERRYGLGAMLVSGGFAGLAGGVMLAGGDFGNYQLVANFGAGIGFAGLLAALVARQRVLVLIFVAFVFGGLRTGSGFLRATGVVRPHLRRRAGPARPRPAPAARHAVRPRAPPGAVRHDLEDLSDERLPLRARRHRHQRECLPQRDDRRRRCCCSPPSASSSPRRRARSTSRSRG